MGICQSCQRRAPRPTKHAHLTREYYGVLIQALRHVAFRHGYALTVHGSLRTDIDLVAVPWRESAVSPEVVAEAIRAAAGLIIGSIEQRPGDPNPTKKPCGRLAWSFYLGPYTLDVPYIDLSVFPPRNADDAAATLPAAEPTRGR